MKIKNIVYLTVIGLIVQASKIKGLPSEKIIRPDGKISSIPLKSEELDIEIEPNNNKYYKITFNKRNTHGIDPEFYNDIDDDPNKVVHHNPNHHSQSNDKITIDNVDNIEYLDSLNKNELYDPKNIYNNTYKNPIYYINQVNKYVKNKKLSKRELNTIIDGVDEETGEQQTEDQENEFFEFGNQLDGFSLFVYETLIDIAFSSTRGVKLSTFYYYGVNFFDLVKDTQINALISTGYSAL